MDEFLKLTRIPIVLYFGDYIPEEPTDKLGGENWRVRLQMGRKFVEAINRYGGNAHFLMSDLNNAEIADLLDKWIQNYVLDKHMPDSADGTEAGQYRIGMAE